MTVLPNVGNDDLKLLRLIE